MKLLCRLVLIITLLSKSFNGDAQIVCGNHLNYDNQLNNPNWIDNRGATALQLQAWKLQNNTGTTDEYVIPVVVHILHNNGPENISDEQVISALGELNTWYWDGIAAELLPFSDMHVGFELARLDPDGNCTTGIIRHQTAYPVAVFGGDPCNSDAYDSAELNATFNSWNPLMYMNIYIVQDIVTLDGSCDESSGILGFATSPTIGNNDVDTDMVVLMHNYVGHLGTASTNEYYVLEHEIGHYFGLEHTLLSQCGLDFSGTPNCTCGNTPEEDCALEGDFCCDTDPWPCCLGNSAPYDCSGIVVSGYCTDSQGNPVNLEDEYRNFMEHPKTECELIVHFTDDQKTLLHFYMENEPRSFLWQTQNLIATGVIWEEPAIESMVYYQECGLANSVTVIPSYSNPELSDNWTFGWFDNEGQPLSNSPILNSGTPGNITLVVTDASGCGTSETILVPQPLCCTSNPNERVFSEDVVINSQNSALLSAELQGYPAYFNGDITVQSGSGFMVTGLNAYFNPESAITVQDDALLQLTFSTLQACSTHWKGIDILAYTGNPGSLVAISSTIKHAEIAVETRDENPIDGPVTGAGPDGIMNTADDETVMLPLVYHAGKVKCSSTDFLNNLRSVHVVDAIYDESECYFLNCNFSVDDDLYSHFPYTSVPECSNVDCPVIGDPGEYFNFVSHVRYDRVHGYPFKGCEFRNEMVDPSHFLCGWEERGTAIRSVNSLYNVMDNDQGVHSEFSGFYTAIHAFNTSGFWNGLTINEALSITTRLVCIFMTYVFMM